VNIDHGQRVKRAEGGHSRRKITLTEGNLLMALPLLFILTALLLWTLIPDPDLEKQPANKRQP
jgi:hypothetical protein